MVKVKVDMTGWKMWEHGVPDSRLIVKKQTEDYVKPSGKHEIQWICECRCGLNKEFIVLDYKIKSGHTKSCGCLNKEQAAITGQNNKKYNKTVLNLEDEHGLYGIGYCSNTNREFYFDMDDYDKIKEYCWRENKMKTGYCRPVAYDKDTGRAITMHQIILGKYYDHSDRNPMNNRKYNLRPATAQENARNHSKSKNNTSGFIGVMWHKKNQKWRSYIKVDNRQKRIGDFENKEGAIKARLEAEAKYFGEFAPQRHLFEQYKINVSNGDSNG